MPAGNNKRILQLLPAEIGWFVMFMNGDGGVFYDRVICWALIETDEGDGASLSYVDAMTNDVEGGICGVEGLDDLSPEFVFKGRDFIPTEAESMRDG